MRIYTGSLSRLGELVGRPPFVLVIGANVAPVFALWALALDRRLSLPVVEQLAIGTILVGTGLALILTGMAEQLLRTSNAGRAVRWSRLSVYRIIAHPVSVGFVLVAIGLSVRAGSPSGYWIVSPVVALLMSAIAYGYASHGTSAVRPSEGPVIRLPRANDGRPGLRDLLSVVVLVFVPWGVLFQSVEILGAPPDAWSSVTALDRLLPVIPWTESIYAFTYPFAMLAPLFARRNRDLRRFALRALLAIAIVIPFYLLLPVVAPAKPVPGAGFWQPLMELERRFDRPITAFPAFHVVWSFLAASVYALTYRRWRPLFWAVAVAISVTCVTTGMHATPDIVAGFVVFLLVAAVFPARSASPHSGLANPFGLGASVHNALRSLPLWSTRGIGVGAGLLVSGSLAGAEVAAWLTAVALAVLVGEALGRSNTTAGFAGPAVADRLGALFGVATMLAALALSDLQLWTLPAAGAVALGVAKVIRRLHEEWTTLRPAHRRAEATARAAPSATSVDPSDGPASHPVGGGSPYSTRDDAGRLFALVCLAAGSAAAVRLWFLGMPLSFVAGVFLILAGLGRAGRREADPNATQQSAGLTSGQWIALLWAVAGMALTTLPAPAAPPPSAPDLSTLALSAVAALMTALVSRRRQA